MKTSVEQALSPAHSEEWTGGSAYPTLVEATVIEELPALLYRLELSNKAQVLAHGAGSAVRNWVRLLPGDHVEVELGEHDLTRGRIVKKIG